MSTKPATQIKAVTCYYPDLHVIVAATPIRDKAGTAQPARHGLIQCNTSAMSDSYLYEDDAPLVPKNGMEEGEGATIIMASLINKVLDTITGEASYEDRAEELLSAVRLAAAEWRETWPEPLPLPYPQIVTISWLDADNDTRCELHPPVSYDAFGLVETDVVFANDHDDRPEHPDDDTYLANHLIAVSFLTRYVL